MPTLETAQIESPAASAKPAPRKRAPRKSRAKNAVNGVAPAPEAKTMAPVEVAPVVAPIAAPEPEPEVEEEFSPALLFLEDFVVTALLSAGRALPAEKLAERAKGWTLTPAALDEALQKSRRVVPVEGEWMLAWHVARLGQSRDERARLPIEALIRELMLAVGKPLPAPVIAREVGLMLNVYNPSLKATVAGIIKTLRFAIEIAPNVYLHEDWMLRVGAPEDEMLIKENRLGRDPDFQGLREFAEITQTAPAAIARELLEFTGGPLNQKVIGFFVHRATPGQFSPRALAAALNDRKQFQPLIDGFVALQEQLADLQSLTGEYLTDLIAPAAPTEAELIEAAAPEVAAQAAAAIEAVEAAAPQTETEAPQSETPIEAMTDEATANGEATPVEAAPVEATPSPEAADLAVRGADVPPYVGVVPENLLPVALQIVDPKTGEPFDFALDDAGLDDGAAKFVHDPMWEDIGEEGEVAALPTPETAPTETKIVMLNHHIRSGTVKIRAVDRAFFGLQEPFSQIQLHDPEDDENLEVWVARAVGVVYEMGQWFDENLPPSGGTMKFARTDKGIEISVDRPDAETFLTPRRLHELEDLRVPAAKLSLFQLLARLVDDHPAGMTLPALWAEVNVVRRTSKRLMASVLSSYDAFSLKEGRNKQMLWFFDKNGGGFKEEKRPFVRR